MLLRTTLAIAFACNLNLRGRIYFKKCSKQNLWNLYGMVGNIIRSLSTLKCLNAQIYFLSLKVPATAENGGKFVSLKVLKGAMKM